MDLSIDKKFYFSGSSVLALHLLLLFSITFNSLKKLNLEEEKDKTVLKIVNMNLGTINSREQTQYLRNSDSQDSTKLNKNSYKKILQKLDRYDQVETDIKSKNLSLSDLEVKEFDPVAIKRKFIPKPLELQGSEIEKFLKDNKARRVQYQDMTPTLNNSKVSVQMDIPEGIEVEDIDQINNVFYSFQRRISLSYINSFYNQLSDFEFKNPHLTFPMTRQEITLVAKATFDSDGNLQQIKMVKWTDKDKLQQFFENVLDGIQSIPNPPKDFVKGKPTFNILYTLKLN